MAGTETIEEFRQRRIAEELRYYEEDDSEHSRSQHGQYTRLLDSFTKAAAAYAISKDDGWYPIAHAVQNLSELNYAIAPHKDHDFKEILTRDDIWHHDNDPIGSIKAEKQPDIRLEEIGRVATSYLDLPFRDTNIDRLLVDTLIVAELYAFGLGEWPRG